MKVELIVPAAHRPGAFGRAPLPPLGLALVAALTPSEVEVSLTDENVSRVNLVKEVDLVGITTTTLTATRAYEIADSFRERGVKVVLGGVHASFIPEEAALHADAVVIGEAEGVWPTLVEDAMAGRLQGVYQRTERPHLAGLPIPRRDLFAKGRYLLSGTVSTSRGCPFSCSFCSASSFFGHSYRFRPVEEVIAEIDALRDSKYLLLTDDNVVGSPRYAKELFKALVPCKKRWAAQASITMAKDEELLRLAAASGCIAVLVGLESISSASLEGVGKKTNVPSKYADAIDRIQSHGIAVHGMFVFGFDEDDGTVFERTVRFCQEMKLATASFGILVPYPGTSLYQSLDTEGRILTKDWTKYDGRVVFEPKRMSAETLRAGTEWAWREFYGLPSVWRRLGKRRPYLLPIWGANLFMRFLYLSDRNPRKT